jgi:uncharacterized protein YukE
MSQGSFRVDPEALRAAGRQLEAQSEALHRSLTRLRSSLPAVPAMCGDDEQGQQFSTAYEPQASRLEEMVQSMALGLSRMAEGLQAMADNYETADAGSRVPGR